MRSVAQLSCTWGVYNQVIDKIKSTSNDPAVRSTLANQQALPARIQIVQQFGQMETYLQNTITSTGEMGTITNVEQQSEPSIITGPGWELSSMLNYIGCYVDNADRDLNGLNVSSSSMTPGTCAAFCAQNNYKYSGVQFSTYCFCGNSYGKYGSVSYTECNMPCGGDSKTDCGGNWRNSIYAVASLPSQAQPSKQYIGTKPLLIVPTARGQLDNGEQFTLRAMVLAKSVTSSPVFNYRALGSITPFTRATMNQMVPNKFVWQVTLPTQATQDDFEYYVQVVADSTTLVFPVTAPAQNQAVIIS